MLVEDLLPPALHSEKAWLRLSAPSPWTRWSHTPLHMQGSWAGVALHGSFSSLTIHRNSESGLSYYIWEFYSKETESWIYHLTLHLPEAPSTVLLCLFWGKFIHNSALIITPKPTSQPKPQNSFHKSDKASIGQSSLILSVSKILHFKYSSYKH